MGKRNAVRLQGRIRTWIDDRGYGFIDAGNGNEVFVHIKDFVGLTGRPEVDQVVSFELGFDARKRRRAVSVELVSAPSVAQREKEIEFRAPLLWRVILGTAVLVLLSVLPWLRVLPMWLTLLVFFLSAFSFLLYAMDKSAAGQGKWRVAESSLLLLDLAGGWPGGLLAQGILRHKVRKESFQLGFWTCMALNLTAIVFIAFMQ